jgi:hypothetical protein
MNQSYARTKAPRCFYSVNKYISMCFPKMANFEQVPDMLLQILVMNV